MADESLIWEGTIDNGAFAVKVHPTENSHTGRLVVKHVASDETLLEQNVTVMMGAIFGPDVSDVAEWQADTITAVDGWYAAHGEVPPTPEGDQPT